MAGKIIADIIEAPYDKITLNVGNTTVLTANGTGITYVPTSNLNINIGSTANLTLGNVVATTANISGLITANGGIKFPATQVDSADVNTLDDYEEGTWTPDVHFGGNKVGVTYTDRAGFYTKIGNAVTITGWFYFSNKGSSSGDATIRGIPFSAASKRAAICLGRFENFSFSVQVSARLDSGTSIDLLETSAAGVISGITNSDFNNGGLLYLSGTYFI